MTAKRIISGEDLKYRNGLRISGDYETRSAGASLFSLTVPSCGLKHRGIPVSSMGLDDKIGRGAIHLFFPLLQQLKSSQEFLTKSSTQCDS